MKAIFIGGPVARRLNELRLSIRSRKVEVPQRDSRVATYACLIGPLFSYRGSRQMTNAEIEELDKRTQSECHPPAAKHRPESV